VTERPLFSTVRGLRGATLQELATGLPACPDELDVFACWSDPADPFGRSPNRRDAAYAAITAPDQLRAVAAAAAALGARRFLLLAPLAAWHQVSAAGRMLPEAMELELAALRVPSIVIMRPTAERLPPADGTRVQRFVRFYLSQLRFMLPASTHALRSLDIARAALAVAAEADRPGLRVVSLDQIRQHASRTGSTGRTGNHR
jgi:hypothetical protein